KKDRSQNFRRIVSDVFPNRQRLFSEPSTSVHSASIQPQQIFFFLRRIMARTVWRQRQEEKKRLRRKMRLAVALLTLIAALARSAISAYAGAGRRASTPRLLPRKPSSPKQPAQ